MEIPSPAAAEVGEPSSASHALRMAVTGLRWLATADTASLPAGVQADALRDLERLAAMHTAARSRVLGSFTAQRGFEDDGQGSPRTWLAWQTRTSTGAARGVIRWMRRLDEHPEIADALAAGEISVSYARQLIDWTDTLLPEHRRDADRILLAAAAEGLDLLGLAELFEEIRRQTAGPDTDPDDGFAHRGLHLDTTLGGAGRVSGDLSSRCATALQEILDSLGKKKGAEDTRTRAQRDHDALEEACTRLIAAGCLPGRAGQPVQLQLHLNLDQYLHGIGTPGVPYLPELGIGTSPARTSGGVVVPGPWTGPGGGPVVPGPWAGPGDDCDAALAPILTGRVHHELLDQLASRLAGYWAQYDPSAPALPEQGRRQGDRPAREPGEDQEAWQARARRAGLSKAAARELILRNALALLSGPSGLASWLRTRTLPGPAASVSLPLDVGTVTDLVPPHLRRAIITRDRHCAAPGCDTPPAACHVHHIVPKQDGGTTSLDNCLLLCRFHHLIFIHRWGWTITLNTDGTTTATSPGGKTLHSHGPPQAA
jgi:Domain of unknown function (DUF222)/HNH endonuclease